MRALALIALAAGAAGCHAAGDAPSAPALTLRLSFAPLSGPAGSVTVTSAILHFAQLTAVSDRVVAGDGRTQIARVDLAIGDELTEPLPLAPPGIYSTVNTQLDSDDHVGLDVQGLHAGESLHAMLEGGALDVSCPTPVRLDPGEHAELALSVDMRGWFDDVDLDAALSDADDQGIVITDDDNRPLATALLAGVMRSFHLACQP